MNDTNRRTTPPATETRSTAANGKTAHTAPDASSKFELVTLALHVARVTVIKGLVVHGAVGRHAWTVTAARSGYGATGSTTFNNRRAAEQYARTISKLVDWRRHPKQQRAAFAWARRFTAKHKVALDTAWSRACQLDTAIDAGWVRP